MSEGFAREIAARVREVREEQGVSQDDAAAALELSQSTYSRIEDGIRTLKGDELVVLADFLGVRAAVITGSAAVRQHAVADARAVASPDDTDIMLDTLYAYLELDRYLHGQAIRRSSLPSPEPAHQSDFMNNETDGRRLADNYRRAYNLGRAPLGDLFELIHSTMELDVVSFDGPPDGHGLSMKDRDTQTTVIAVAITEHPMRQRSSIAHELGHVQAGDLDDSSQELVAGERTLQEARADAFARHLLLPLDAITTSRATLSELSNLVQKYGVSPSIAAIQLKEKNLIDETTCRTWQQLSTATLATMYGWLDQYKTMTIASKRPRAPQGLMRRSALAYAQGVLGIDEIAAWYHAPADDLEQELASLKSEQQREKFTEPDPWNLNVPLFETNQG